MFGLLVATICLRRLLVAISSLRLRGIAAINGLLVSDWLLVNWLLVAAIGDWLRVAAISDRLGVNDGLRSVLHGRPVRRRLNHSRFGAVVQSLGFDTVGAARVTASGEAAKSTDTTNGTGFEQTSETKARSELTSEATGFELILKRITAKRRSFEAIFIFFNFGLCVTFCCFIVEIISCFTVNLDSTLRFYFAFSLDFASNFEFGTNFSLTNCLEIGVNLLLAANLRLRSSFEVYMNFSFLWDLKLLSANLKLTLYLKLILSISGVVYRCNRIAGRVIAVAVAISGSGVNISRVVDEVKLVEGSITVVCVVLVDISLFGLVKGQIRVIHAVFVDVSCRVIVIGLFVGLVISKICVVGLILIDICGNIDTAVAGDTARAGLLSVVTVRSNAILLGLFAAVATVHVRAVGAI